MSAIAFLSHGLSHPMPVLDRRTIPNKIPALAESSYIISIVLSLTAASIVSFCIARRLVGAHSFRTMPLARWLILAIFTDSWLFIFSSTILQSSIGLNRSLVACDAGILLCLVCYLSSKLIYMFLVEKVFIIRGSRKSRWQDRLWMTNMICMMIPYCIVITLTFVYRNAQITEDGVCRIGLKLPANIPLLIFDFVVNVYLTHLFLAPLRGLWSFKNGAESKQRRLRRVAIRTFIGSCATLISTLANLISLLILRGKEPGWVCFAICNADVVFSVLVLHWVTHQDDDISTVTHANKYSKNMNTPAHSANPFSGRFTQECPVDKNFGARVVTNCEAEGEKDDVPLHGIVRKTALTRTTEVQPVNERGCESRGSSEAELYMPKAVGFEDKGGGEGGGRVSR